MGNSKTGKRRSGVHSRKSHIAVTSCLHDFGVASLVTFLAACSKALQEYAGSAKTCFTALSPWTNQFAAIFLS